MMKKLLFILFFFIFNHEAISQNTYGFEWIDFSKPHYKIPITTNNVYRLSQSFLAANCPEILSANVDEICIFNKGKQIPIYITWTSSAGASDFIEFYAEKLDGSIDSKLYKDSNNILNPFTSFLSDTNYYILTLRSGTNQRFTIGTNDTTSPSSYAPFCIATALNNYRVQYNSGLRFYYTDVEYVESPEYDRGEGYGTTAYNSIAISTPQVSTSSTTYEPKMWLKIFGRNSIAHKLKFNINNTTVNESSFYNSDMLDLKTTVPLNLLTSATTNLAISATNPGSHGYCLGFVELKYPRNFNFTSTSLYKFQLPQSSTAQKIQITNYSSSADVFLYDFTTKTRLNHTNGASLRFAVNSASTDNDLLIFNNNIVSNITSIRKINFSNLIQQRGNYLMIASKNLSADSNGNNIFYDYKLYKESQAGGGYNGVIAYTDELSELFSYGISKHPLSIKKYLQWANNTWTPKAEYAFIIGKGNAVTGLLGATSAVYNANMIPAYGTPASDFGYATGDTSILQFMPIGRLSASTPYQVMSYLNKLKEYDLEYNATTSLDQKPDKKEYMKWVIHLAGGTGIEQQTNYRTFLQEFEKTIKDTLYGAKAFSIFKNSVDVSQDFTSVDLDNRINKGVSLITFFGHSSATLFDVGIGAPSTFVNKGKYPAFLANGCNSGSVFGGGSYSEDFVNLPDKGAIGFIATTNYALDVSLYNYCRMFYDNLSKNSYNTTLGKLVNASSNRMLVEVSNMNLNYLYSTAQEYNLNGDPTVRFAHYDKPDYYIDRNSVIFPKTQLNVTMDSFEMKLIVQNLGKAISKTIKVKVERQNNGTKAVYEYDIAAPYFKDTYSLKLPILDNTIGAGSNTFSIKVESAEVIPELAETNNEILNSFDIYIESDDVLPMYPFEYSILGGAPKVTLMAATTKFDNPLRKYYIEFDTTEGFNSPLKKVYVTTTTNSVLQYEVPLTLVDSTVYYWRVTKDSTSPTNGYRWNTSSFIYLSQQTKGGWNQSHYYQFLKDKYANIELPTSRNFKFINDFKNIFIRTDGSSNTYEVEWYLNTVRQAVLREAGRMNSGFHVIWMDGKTGIAHQSLDSNYGAAIWGSYGSIRFGYMGIPREGFVFPDTGNTPATHPKPNTPWNTIFMDFVNQIPDNDYLIIYSNKKPVYQKWSSTLTGFFNSNGFSNLSQLTDTIVKAPFIFAFRKNNPSFTPITKIGTDYITKTTANLGIYGNWKEGYIESPEIGPALKWNRFQFKSTSADAINKDSNVVELYGIKNNVSTILSKFSTDIDTPIDWIDQAQYPKLKLRLYSKDELNRTPTQLNYWRLLFDEVPEITTNNTLDNIPVNKDTIDVGESISLSFGVQTLNEIPFDSMMVKIILTQGGNKKEFYFKKQPIKGNTKDIITFDLVLNDYFVGQNDILYEINPLNNGYQKEKFSINNYGKMSFYVRPDVKNPLLDVTFDGVHIINNELISSKPKIKIVLKDENKFLLLNDTSLISLSLKNPDGTIVPIYFNQSSIKFTPAASGTKNYAQIEYTPEFTDGLYALIVKDRDVSGNSSSTSKGYNYKIGFRVISKTQISQVLNYPNPFSTSTSFVFTITGSKIPDMIKIQIMTIRGQIVKEINKEQLGSLKIGLNKTTYTWDGRDEYGDLLANGVYLYKVTIKDNGKEVEKMSSSDFKSVTNSSTDLSKYFKENFGKMVILR